MKLLKQTILILSLCFAFSSCKNNKSPKVVTVESAAMEQSNDAMTKPAKDSETVHYAQATFTIKGMTCEMGCAKTIEKKLAKLEGVGAAKVDFKKELATVQFDVTKITAEDLQKTVTDAGSSYSVEDLKIAK